MCVIIVATEKHPTIDELEAAEKTNPHGGAIAWKGDDGLLHYVKDIDSDDVNKIIMEKSPPFPYIIHFRITSSGTTRPELCHPFPINHSVTLKTKWTGKSSVLFHNGTFRDWREMVASHSGDKDFPKGHIWSDSRAIAWLAYKTKKNIFKFIDEKIAILNLDGTVEYYGDFDHKDTFILSNTNHHKVVWKPKKYANHYQTWRTPTIAKTTKTTAEEQAKADLEEEESLWQSYLGGM